MITCCNRAKRKVTINGTSLALCSAVKKVPEGDSPDNVTYLFPQQIIDGILIPSGYEVWRDGVYHHKPKLSASSYPPPTPSITEDAPVQHVRGSLNKICSRPIYVAGSGSRIDDQQDLIQLRFLPAAKDVTRAESWRTLWLTRSDFADKQKLLKYSGSGMPVNSSNSTALVNFLDACLSMFTGDEQTIHIVRRLGYHEIDNKSGWLIGTKWIGTSELAAVPDPNQHEICRAVHEKGSLQGWCDFVRQEWARTDESWIVRWSTAIAFASPLLRPLNERTFCVHHYASTHSGKTILAMLGQSVWGHPRKFMIALNRATTNGLTEIFKYVSDVSLLFDETEKAEVDLDKFVYHAAEEVNKVRGRQDGGIQQSTSEAWKLIIRTTGERQLVNKNLGGGENRALEFRHPGVGSETASAQLWQRIQRMENYGVAGISFLTKLAEVVNNPKRREKLVNLHLAYKTELQKLNEAEGTKRALERQLAVIMLGERLMLEWIFGYSPREATEIALADTVKIMSRWLRERPKQHSLSDRVIEYLIEHRTAYPNMYVDASTNTSQVMREHKSYGGLMALHKMGADFNEICYLPSQFEALIEKQFETSAGRILEELVDKGVLRRGADRIPLSRSLKGVMPSTPMYVFVTDKLFAAATQVETFDLSGIDPELLSSEDYLF